MASQGYIKLHRKILDSKIFSNPKLLKVWVWCLCKASHKAHDQMVGRQIQHLEPGQFIYGRKTASKELKIPESTLNDYMRVLKSDNAIDIKTNNKYSVISIVNWRLYQIDEQKTNTNSDTKDNNKWTTNGQQMDTNKNVKNEKNEKNDYYFNHYFEMTAEERRKYLARRSEEALKGE